MDIAKSTVGRLGGGRKRRWRGEWQAEEKLKKKEPP